jgi:hypothetical protein
VSRGSSWKIGFFFLLIVSTFFIVEYRESGNWNPTEVIIRESPAHGQIITDPENRAWFAYAGAGKHFLAGAGDPEDFLYRGELLSDGTRRGDQAKIINSLASAGVNGIYFQAIRSHGGDGDATHNPFLNHDPVNGFNEAILNQWQEWIHLLDANGIVSYFFIYDDSARIWDTGDLVSNAERDFVVTLVKKFRNARHLVWVIAEEYEERYTSKRISRLAQLIKEADGRGHPVSVHKLPGIDFSEFANDPNIDQFAMQVSAGSAAELNASVAEAFVASAGRYNLNMSENGMGSGSAAREKSWAAALGGAYVMVFEMDGVNSNHQDQEDLGRLKIFMETTGFDTLRPSNDLVAGDALYAAAKPPYEFIVFAKTSAERQILVKSVSSNSYHIRWFDPARGKSLLQTLDSDSDTLDLMVPPGFDDQVVVHLVSIPARKNLAPLIQNFSLVFEKNEIAPIRLGFQKSDGRELNYIGIVDFPAYGEVSGTGHDRAYFPSTEPSSTDRFVWGDWELGGLFQSRSEGLTKLFGKSNKNQLKG